MVLINKTNSRFKIVPNKKRKFKIQLVSSNISGNDLLQLALNIIFSLYEA